MDQGLSGEGVENTADPLFALQVCFVWTDESIVVAPTSFSVALVHSWFSSSELSAKRTSSADTEKIFRLTSCSAVRGSRGIRILGSARGRGGRSNRVGLGRAASISAPPFSPRTARASAAGFDWIAWAYQSATRERPLISCRLGVFQTVCSVLLPPSSLSSPVSPLPQLPSERRKSA